MQQVAQRIGRSTEQVRRYLREGKLKGQRVGNQWLVDASSLGALTGERRPLVLPELMEEIARGREAIFKRNHIVFDVVQLLREERESH